MCGNGVSNNLIPIVKKKFHIDRSLIKITVESSEISIEIDGVEVLKGSVIFSD